MFIQPWDATLDDAEWRTWIADGHDFGIPDDPEQARARVEHLRRLLPDTVTVGISGDAAAARGLNA
ncbi:hypothetical protein [Streptomyces sp. NPDC059787]|uniref:hypothetical protein n=1 Tax=Streptomyces sp. NPDC059787 TaxID=3346947 RepID=UPI003647C80E